MLPGKEDRMNYQELWNEENTQITERYDLASDRIQEIPGENRILEPFRSYFTEMSRFAGQIEELARRQTRAGVSMGARSVEIPVIATLRGTSPLAR